MVQRSSAGSGGATTVYVFTGSCSDCSNPVGYLTMLSSWAPGSAINVQGPNTNLVSFVYSSSVPSAALTLSPSNLTGVSGNLPTTLPHTAIPLTFYTAGGSPFIIGSAGSWCVNSIYDSCDQGGNGDYGTAGYWNLQATTVPVMSTPALISLAFLLAALGFYFRKQLFIHPVA